MTRMLCPFLLLAVVAGAVFAAAEIPGEAFAVSSCFLSVAFLQSTSDQVSWSVSSSLLRLSGKSSLG